MMLPPVLRGSIFFMLGKHPRPNRQMNIGWSTNVREEMQMMTIFGPYSKWIIVFLIVYVLLVLLMPMEPTRR